MRHIQLATTVLALLLLASAQAHADFVSLSTTTFAGTMQGVVPGGIQVGTPYGVAVVPTAVATFQVGKVRMQYTKVSTLAIGTPVTVVLPPMNAQVVNLQGSLANLQMNRGPLVLPAPYLPVTYTKKAKVYVQLANGNVVHVPLNAALNMQRAQGAHILGTTYAAPVVGPGNPHGHNQEHGGGHGKGHGKGHGHD